MKQIKNVCAWLVKFAACTFLSVIIGVVVFSATENSEATICASLFGSLFLCNLAGLFD